MHQAVTSMFSLIELGKAPKSFGPDILQNETIFNLTVDEMIQTSQRL